MFFNPHQRTVFPHSFFREGGRGERKGERETLFPERSMDWVASSMQLYWGSPCALAKDHRHPYRGLNCNLGVCPDQESNAQPLSYRTILQPSKLKFSELKIRKEEISE